MDKELLKWAIAHSDPNAPAESVPSQEPPSLDPEIIEAILGKSEAQKILDCMQIIKNTANPLDTRLNALEMLEASVQAIDNAIVADELNIWPDLFSCLEEKSTDIRLLVLWVLGTCAQNNLAVQESPRLKPAIALCLDILETDCDRLQQKAVYCLSALVRNCEPNLDRFLQNNGLGIFDMVVGRSGDPQSALCMKIAHFLNFVSLESERMRSLLKTYASLSALLEQA